MNKRLLLAGMGILAISGLLLSSCSGEDDTVQTVGGEEPSLFVTPTALSVTSEGGACTVTYAVSNASSDGSISCTASADWITDLADNGAGTLNFNVGLNASEQSRQGTISVTYTTSALSLSETVTVTQDAGVAPTLSISTESIDAGYEGGSYSFTYTVAHPATDGVFTCEADADWITDFDTSTDRTVGFVIAENEGEEGRSAVITATYTSSYGAVSAQVTVTQDFDDGVITIDDVIGTYTATGITYNSAWDYTSATEPGIDNTWTVTIYPDPDNEDGVIIDGLVPEVAGFYNPNSASSTKAYIAKATLDMYGGRYRIVIKPQYTGFGVPTSYDPSTYWYIAWMQIAVYAPYDGYGDYSAGWHIALSDTTDARFWYNPEQKIWEDDYGMVIGNFATYGDFSTSPVSCYGMFAPGAVLTKVSSSTGTAAASSAASGGPAIHSGALLGE